MPQPPLSETRALDSDRDTWTVPGFADAKAILACREAVVLGAEDLEMEGSDPHLSAIARGGRMRALWMWGADDDRHAACRRAMAAAVGPKALPQVASTIEARASDLLGASDRAPIFDLVDQYARPLVRDTLMDMIGVPAAHRSKLEASLQSMSGFIPGGRPGAAGYFALAAIAADVEDIWRRDLPAGAVASRALLTAVEKGELSKDEALAQATLLLFANSYTTLEALTGLMVRLSALPTGFSRLAGGARRSPAGRTTGGGGPSAWASFASHPVSTGDGRHPVSGRPDSAKQPDRLAPRHRQPGPAGLCASGSIQPRPLGTAPSRLRGGATRLRRRPSGAEPPSDRTSGSGGAVARLAARGRRNPGPRGLGRHDYPQPEDTSVLGVSRVNLGQRFPVRRAPCCGTTTCLGPDTVRPCSTGLPADSVTISCRSVVRVLLRCEMLVADRIVDSWRRRCNTKMPKRLPSPPLNHPNSSIMAMLRNSRRMGPAGLSTARIIPEPGHRQRPPTSFSPTMRLTPLLVAC